MIHVIAVIQTSPGKRNDVLALFRELVPKVHAEEGCLEYGPTVDADTGMPVQQTHGDDAFTVVEKWESLDHLKAHLDAPHMVEYRESVKDLVVGVTLNILEPA